MRAGGRACTNLFISAERRRRRALLNSAQRTDGPKCVSCASTRLTLARAATRVPLATRPSVDAAARAHASTNTMPTNGAARRRRRAVRSDAPRRSADGESDGDDSAPSAERPTAGSAARKPTRQALGRLDLNVLGQQPSGREAHGPANGRAADARNDAATIADESSPRRRRPAKRGRARGGDVDTGATLTDAEGERSRAPRVKDADAGAEGEGDDDRGQADAPARLTPRHSSGSGEELDSLAVYASALHDTSPRSSSSSSSDGSSGASSDNALSLSTPTSTEEPVVSYARQPQESDEAHQRASPSSAVSRRESAGFATRAANVVAPSFVVQYDWPDADDDDREAEAAAANSAGRRIGSRGGKRRARATASAAAAAEVARSSMAAAGTTRRRHARGRNGRRHGEADARGACDEEEECGEEEEEEAEAAGADTLLSARLRGAGGGGGNRRARQARRDSTAAASPARLAPHVARFLEQQRAYWRRIDAEERLAVMDEEAFHAAVKR